MSDTTDTPTDDAPVEDPAADALLADDAPPEADVQPDDEAVDTFVVDAEPAVELDHDPSQGVVPAQVDVEVDRDLLPGFYSDEVTIPEGIEETFKPSVQIHTYKGETLTLDKVTMSIPERNHAIAAFEAEIDGLDIS